MRSLLEQIVNDGLWGESDLGLVDVGASGGIDGRWSAFGNRLAAVGFEPLIAEAARLNATETRPKVRYEAALVGCPDYDALFPPELRTDEVRSRHIQPFGRSSAVLAHRVQQQDYVREVFNAGAEVAYSERFVSLDQYFSDSPLRPNFLKIDTDGSDFQVLLGGRRLLESADLLGIQIEVQFHGAVHPYANTFANIDRLLREHGFSLFDLEPYRYSRAALPAPFAVGLPAQTISGQVHWGEAVYFRDLSYPLYEQMFGKVATRERLLKLCTLLVLFGLADCAAELLETSSHLTDLPAREALLDALTPRLFGDERYREYVARFHRTPADWLPQNLATKAAATRASASTADPIPAPDHAAHPRATWVDSVVHARNERLQAAVQELRTRVEGLKKIQRKLRRQLEERNQKIKRLRGERSDTAARLQP